MRRCVVLLIMLITVSAALFAQASSGTPGTSQDQRTSIEAKDAEPYEPAEFPAWAIDMRRAEIVSLGSLPFTLLTSRLLYGVGRFVVQSVSAGAIAPEYLPALFAPPNAVPMTREDNAWVLVGSFTLSAIIATIDYFLGVRETSP